MPVHDIFMQQTSNTHLRLLIPQDDGKRPVVEARADPFFKLRKGPLKTLQARREGRVNGRLTLNFTRPSRRACGHFPGLCNPPEIAIRVIHFFNLGSF